MRKRNSWRLAPATDLHIRSWSYGSVNTVEDLYSPAIFGAATDLRCDCGQLQGESVVGQSCPRCRVFVETDAAEARRRRMGKIALACHCKHPLTQEWLTLFPVAPIGFRVNKDGNPNELGKKYEALCRANAALKLVRSGD